MSDYERAYPVDTSAGSTETNSTAWVKNEQEHLRIYRLLNSQNARLEKSINEVKTLLQENNEKLTAYNKKYTELMQALTKSTEDALSEINTKITEAIAELDEKIASLDNTQYTYIDSFTLSSPFSLATYRPTGFGDNNCIIFIQTGTPGGGQDYADSAVLHCYNFTDWCKARSYYNTAKACIVWSKLFKF